MLRSIASIIAGFFVMMLLTMMTISSLGVILPESLNTANTTWIVANLIYGAIFALVGGYVTAWIAQKSEVKHATILAGIMLVMTVLTFIMTITSPSLAESDQPMWYYPILALISTPATIAGGYFRAQQMPKSKQQFAG